MHPRQVWLAQHELTGTLGIFLPQKPFKMPSLSHHRVILFFPLPSTAGVEMTRSGRIAHLEIPWRAQPVEQKFQLDEVMLSGTDYRHLHIPYLKVCNG
jgi:hypothetical protein